MARQYVLDRTGDWPRSRRCLSSTDVEAAAAGEVVQLVDLGTSPALATGLLKRPLLAG